LPNIEIDSFGFFATDEENAKYEKDVTATLDGIGTFQTDAR